MRISEEKSRIREEVWRKFGCRGKIPPFRGQDKAALLLAALPEYRRARRVFSPPDGAQLEARLQILKDGKILIVATPGLRDGFYGINPEEVPERLWKEGVSIRGIRRIGRKLRTSFEDIGEIDLMITGAVAVSLRGERIGKGTGFFDQEFLILRSIGCVREETPIAALVDDQQVFEELPFGEHDVPVDIIITPTRLIRIPERRKKPSELPSFLVDFSKRPYRELFGQKI